MKQLTTLIFLALCFSSIIFTSCKKERVDPTNASPSAIDESNYYTPSLSDFAIDFNNRAYWTTIPAGSTDALQVAIDNANPGGIIYLKAGIHRESDRVTVNKPVKIIGEAGAVLMITSSDSVSTLNPAIYVLNAPGTAIQNLIIQPINDVFATAVIFENSPRSALLSSSIEDFGISVWIERSDQFALIGNKLSGASFWSVMVDNGSSAYLADNEIFGNGLGMWLCDRWGTLERNHFHDNRNGLLLCKYNVIFEQTTPNSSDPVGADYTCTAWKVRNNQFNNHENAGMFIRDGSTLNLITIDNTFYDNTNYDIVIPPDEFAGNDPNGLFIPAALKNTIYATDNVIIKDCGIDNIINGGTLADTSIDPC